ncbi:hypothetical protein LCGC14_1571160 [marine sediment metagenome]|uniref:HIT domain-containing protein n=1 Tax=marine sediment metagenome TaxID=412755 RepID=A0A0F9L0U0_9ZZZZ
MVPEHSHAGVAVFYDDYPVTEGHMIIVPMQNEERFLNYCFTRALKIGNEKVAAREWASFNIGYNEGKEAGRTVDWPHLHLIPRREGDVKDPTGGVRAVIPNRQNYKKSKHYKKGK